MLHRGVECKTVSLEGLNSKVCLIAMHVNDGMRREHEDCDHSRTEEHMSLSDPKTQGQ